MKFRLVDTYRYWWPVTVNVPDPDQSGRFAVQTFEILFEAVPADEAQRIDDAFQALTSDADRRSHEHTLLARVIRDWRGVEADGHDAEFSGERLGLALRWPWFRAGCYRAYAQSLTGEEARLGN